MHFSRSHIQRWAISAGVAWAKNATGGRNYVHATRDYDTLYRLSVLGATMCFDELGINGADQRLGMEHWRKLRADGIQGIVKPTLTPQTTSRDGWRTIEGQTATSDVPGFLKWDAWLLDGAPVKRDWSAVVEAGATGPDIVRCAVVDSAGKLTRKGDPAHIFGSGGVVDWNPVVSQAGAAEGGSRRIWRTDLGLSTPDYGDGLHPGDGIHEVMAGYLKRAMPVVLAPTARRQYKFWATFGSYRRRSGPSGACSSARSYRRRWPPSMLASSRGTTLIVFSSSRWSGVFTTWRRRSRPRRRRAASWRRA